MVEIEIDGQPHWFKNWLAFVLKPALLFAHYTHNDRLRTALRDMVFVMR